MINQDTKNYKGFSAARRRDARVKKFSEVLLFAACINLIGFSLATLVPNGMWVFLFTFALGVAGVTAMTVKFFGK